MNRTEYRNTIRDLLGMETAFFDPTGQLPNGEPFDDIVGLKRELMGRSERLGHCLTEKLLTDATGRALGFNDRDEVGAITREHLRRGGGLRDLIALVTQSKAFRSR